MSDLPAGIVPIKHCLQSRIMRLESELSTLKARLSAAERVIEAFRIYNTEPLLSCELDVVIEHLDAYDQLTQRKEEGI